MSVGNWISFEGGWPRLAAACAWLVAGASLLSSPAWAGSFQVNPVHINLPADRQVSSLTITNSDSAPVSVRVITLAWTQVDGMDVHTPTNNIIASPPIFTIPPGKTQIVRIGLKSRDGTRAYRVIFEEIPRQTAADGQVRVALRLDLPLYVLPKGGGKADLKWQAWRDGAGDLFIQGSNSGSLHTQVVELSAKTAGGEQVLSKQMGVVLPNSARVWKIGKGPDLELGTPFTLKVRSSSGESQTQIQLVQR